jgi:hypothetical protein
VSWIHVRSFLKKIHELLYSKSINYFNNLSYKSSMYKDNSLGEESGLASSPISWCSSKGRAYKYYLQLYFTLKIDIATYYSYICILCFFSHRTHVTVRKKKKNGEPFTSRTWCMLPREGAWLQPRPIRRGRHRHVKENKLSQQIQSLPGGSFFIWATLFFSFFFFYHKAGAHQLPHVFMFTVSVCLF